MSVKRENSFVVKGVLMNKNKYDLYTFLARNTEIKDDEFDKIIGDIKENFKSDVVEDMNEDMFNDLEEEANRMIQSRIESDSDGLERFERGEIITYHVPVKV